MVLVQGTKIVAAGTDLSIPAGAEVIDLGDATLSPGFIDAHTHLTGESTDDWKQGFVDRFRREVAERAIESTVYARKVLEAGFTTVRDVGSEDLLDVGLRNAIVRGLVPGPRMLVAVHALGCRGGHSDETGIRHDLLKELGPADGIAHGPAGFREAVRFQVKYGADVIKFCASGGVLSLADEVDTPQLTPEEMNALVDEAHRLRKKVAAHCHGDRAAREAILAGVDSIEHGSFLGEETLALMKAQGTYLVPTLLAARVDRRQAGEIPARDRRQGEGRPRRPLVDVPRRRAAASPDRVRHGFGGLPARDQRQGVRPDDRAGDVAARRPQVGDLRQRGAARDHREGRHPRAGEGRRRDRHARRPGRRHHGDRARVLRHEGREDDQASSTQLEMTRWPGPAVGAEIPRQYESELMTSPPAIVPRARQVLPSMELLMKWTLPSANTALTPPGW